MKFLVDAQLPRRLARWLSEKGFDTLHTLDLPDKNSTTDHQISDISIREQRVVISKDSDFYDRYFDKLEPWKLLFLTVGNLSNDALIELFEKNMDQIIAELETAQVIQMSRTTLTIIA